MTDLSVIISARNEEFLQRTIDSVLNNSEADTEVIAVLDGYWPDPGIKDHPRVTLIHHKDSIGQRAAVNEGARYSQAKFVMKLDAHCKVSKGFDAVLMSNTEYDWTVVPRMYNLHAFDWKCRRCGHRVYQGPKPERCKECGSRYIKKKMVWKEKTNPASDFMRFDRDMKFQYWRDYKKRPEAKGDIVDQLSAIGACWVMHRDRFWELGGLDERHGSWGQLGTEVACKSWLSGGRQVVNKKAWFAHMFRTGGGFGFPYPNKGVKQARKHSQDMWLNDKWEGATRPLSWLLDKFAPVPEWGSVPKPVPTPSKPTKGLVYYTDNQCEERILQVARNQLTRSCNGMPIVSVSLYPIDFGDNITVDLERSKLTMFRQMLAGLERIDTDIVFFVEHDVIYHPSHFDFTPPRDDIYCYNRNVWKVRVKDGQAVHYLAGMTSGLCAYRSLLLEHYRKRVKVVAETGYNRRMGYEPGTHRRKEAIDDHGAEYYFSEHPNVDICHGNNVSWKRFDKSQFRNKPQGWKLADEIPFWGKTKGRFDEFIRGIDQ